MDPTQELFNDLILGVCHLCERVRGLARTGSRDPIALVPVREASQMVSTTLEALAALWLDGPEAALPSTPLQEALQDLERLLPGGPADAL